jgi:hypothetical protein
MARSLKHLLLIVVIAGPDVIRGLTRRSSKAIDHRIGRIVPINDGAGGCWVPRLKRGMAPNAIEPLGAEH